MLFRSVIHFSSLKSCYAQFRLYFDSRLQANIVSFAITYIKLNRKAELNLQDWLEVFIVPVCSIWILISVFITGTLENYFWGFIVVFMILLINVFTYYLYDKAKENMEKQMREEILKNQCEYYIRQNRESKEWWEELRKLRHNMKQHYILENTYLDRKSTRLNSSHSGQSRMPSSA